MRQDVVRCRRGITIHNKAFEEEHAEYRRQKVKQVNDTGNPGLGTGRRFCNPFHHCSCAHIGFPARRFALWDHSTTPVNQLSVQFHTLRTVDWHEWESGDATLKIGWSLRRFLTGEIR